MGEIEYHYRTAGTGRHHSYLLPAIDKIVAQTNPGRIFDLGCGNGSVGHHLSQNRVIVGIDPSQMAITIANQSYPHLTLELGSAYDDLVARFGQFPMVISLEVVEHLYDPRRWASALFRLLEPGGVAIISAPYHGYWKNLALALSGSMDSHFTALWDGGHIKFWSVRTLSQLLNEAGLKVRSVERVGRVSVLAKSMIISAEKPRS